MTNNKQFIVLYIFLINFTTAVFKPKRQQIKAGVYLLEVVIWPVGRDGHFVMPVYGIHIQGVLKNALSELPFCETEFEGIWPFTAGRPYIPSNLFSQFQKFRKCLFWDTHLVFNRNSSIGHSLVGWNHVCFACASKNVSAKLIDSRIHHTYISSLRV